MNRTHLALTTATAAAAAAILGWQVLDAGGSDVVTACAAGDWDCLTALDPKMAAEEDRATGVVSFGPFTDDSMDDDQISVELRATAPQKDATCSDPILDYRDSVGVGQSVVVRLNSGIETYQLPVATFGLDSLEIGVCYQVNIGWPA